MVFRFQFSVQSQEKVEQLFVISFTGTTAGAGILGLLERHAIGGVALFNRNCTGALQTRTLLSELQAASRSLLIRLAPKDRIAQYFGLFALTGKVTSFVGPLLIGIVTAATASQKAGMAVLVLFFVTGLVLLGRVKTNHPVVPGERSETRDP